MSRIHEPTFVGLIRAARSRPSFASSGPEGPEGSRRAPRRSAGLSLTLCLLSALFACTDGEPTEPDGGAGGMPGLGVGASLEGWRLFPDDNPWNTDVSQAPVDPASAALIEACGVRGLHPDFGAVWQGVPNGIPYVVVDGHQKRVPVSFSYDDESDPGPYPIPADAPVGAAPVRRATGTFS